MEIMTQKELEEFLSKPNLARIATVGKNCTPHIAPVWFLYENGTIIIGTSKASKKIKNIRNKPDVAISIDTSDAKTGNRGAIFSGKAELVETDSEETIKKLCIKYLGNLDNPVAKQLLQVKERSIIKLKPQKTISWDSSKMGK